MGNACCRASSAAVASAPARERQRQPSEPPGVPDWTEVVPLFREGVRGHPTVKERYVLEELLGVGGFGVVWLAVSRNTTSTTGAGESTSARRDPEPRRRRRVACKTIPWSSLKQAETVEVLRRDSGAVDHGVPAAPPGAGAAARGVRGRKRGAPGDGPDRIGRRGAWTEHRAAGVARALVEAVRALHGAGTMHRDLKPDNLMFSGHGAEEQLKVIDFGFAISFRPGETFTDEVGSFPYMAQEVFARSYGPEAGVWSAGVVVYQLLWGRHPFPAPDDTCKGQRKATLRGAADVDGHPWPLVSGGARGLVLAMLEPDPSRRPTALRLLEHPWLKAAAIASEAPAPRGLI
ncbi:hypothetical protein PAHAL_9G131700 [Panicum hallii]|uniref:Protein kinase domain-containing protein n=1 Tax=Panicum hallii TaxID=206008 RepID=A0A2S3IJ84_9POAL|nr:calcium-dependent protein kinase 9-like [Panicum hallii]PAN45633.1 hypothetical protein PAHAL_9G131700 [Panicum hallii]